MEELKKKYTPYTESERMSYIREYLSTSETKYQFAKRTGICRRLLILWLEKYHINDKVMNTEQPSLSKASDESLNELEKELEAAVRKARIGGLTAQEICETFQIIMEDGEC